jgi:hypothetical protein
MKQRLFAGALALGLLVALGATQVAAGPRQEGFSVVGGVSDAGRITEAKSASGQLAQTDPSLLGRDSARAVNVVVKLDYDPVASYAGGLAGLRATSPSVTGRSLDARPAAVRDYLSYVEDFESDVRSGISAAVPGARITQSFTFAYGGLAVRLPLNQVGALLSVDGVAAVQRDALQQPLQVQEPFQFIGAEAVWPSLGGTDRAGEGVLVANLDTGIWPENPMLEDLGVLPGPPGSYACEFGLSGDPNDPAFACNNKVVGAYAFTDTYTSVFDPEPDEYCAASGGGFVCSARDADGHGTHTLTTAAGDFVDSAQMWGIDRGPTSGMASSTSPSAVATTRTWTPSSSRSSTRMRTARSSTHRPATRGRTPGRPTTPARGRTRSAPRTRRASTRPTCIWPPPTAPSSTPPA